MEREVFYATTTIDGNPLGQVLELTAQNPVRVLDVQGANVTNRADLLSPLQVGEVLQLEATEPTVRVQTMSVEGLPWPLAVEDEAPPDPSALVPSVPSEVAQLEQPSPAPALPVGPRMVSGVRNVINGPPSPVVIVTTPRHLQGLTPIAAPVPAPATEDADAVARRLAQVGRIVR